MRAPNPMPLYVSSGVTEYLIGLTVGRVDFASDIAFETADDIVHAHALSGSSTQVGLCPQVVTQPNDSDTKAASA